MLNNLYRTNTKNLIGSLPPSPSLYFYTTNKLPDFIHSFLFPSPSVPHDPPLPPRLPLLPLLPLSLVPSPPHCLRDVAQHHGPVLAGRWALGLAAWWAWGSLRGDPVDVGLLGGGESEGLGSTSRRGEGPLLVEDEEGSGAHDGREMRRSEDKLLE